MVSLVLCRNRRREKKTASAEEKRETSFIIKMRRPIPTIRHARSSNLHASSDGVWVFLFCTEATERSPIDEVALRISLVMSVFSFSVFLFPTPNFPGASCDLSVKSRITGCGRSK